MLKEKDYLINNCLPYISLLSNNPSNYPFVELAITDIKVSMVSVGRVEF